MSTKAINPNKIVVFTGAGISAESGLKTFRRSGGLWEDYPVDLVASRSAWRNDPQLVLEFFNQRRLEAANAQPNKAHIAIARLESTYDVVVITQNIDSLHEQAGSSNVLHLHGKLSRARSSADPQLSYEIGTSAIQIGEKCELNSQLRPDVVLFEECPFYLREAKEHIREAACVLAVGSSLTVEPAASLLKRARFHATKILITLTVEKVPYGFKLERGMATSLVPHFCDRWLSAGKFIY